MNGAAVEPIKVECPGCSRKLKASWRSAGKTVACPACKTPIAIPEPELRIVDEDVAAPAITVESKPCKGCANLVPIGAVRCMFCGAALMDPPKRKKKTDTLPAVKAKEGDFYTDALWSLLYPLVGIMSFFGFFLVTLVAVVANVGFSFIQARGTDGAYWLGMSGKAFVLFCMYSYATSILYEIVQSSSARDMDVPSVPTPFDRGLWPGFQNFALSVVCFAPVLALAVITRGAEPSLGMMLVNLAVFLPCALIYNLCFLGMAISESLLALSPVGVLRSLKRTFGPSCYALLAGVSTTMLILSAALWFLYYSIHGGLGALMFASMLLPAFALIAVAISARVLGLLYYHYEGRLRLTRAA